MADIYNIGEFLGIAQHRDGSLLNTGTAIDARNMDTSDGNLSVAKGYVRKSGNAIPSSAGQILRIIPVDESNILAVTQNSIYHGTYDTWNLTPIYTFGTTLPVTCQIGYALGKINTTNVVVIGTGKTQLIKVNMGDTVTAEIFGSGLYIFETTVASYADNYRFCIRFSHKNSYSCRCNVAGHSAEVCSRKRRVHQRRIPQRLYYFGYYYNAGYHTRRCPCCWRYS